MLFIDYKIKATHVKQIIICNVITKNLWDCHFFMNDIFTLWEPDVFQRMREATQKCILRLSGKRLYTQCPGTHMLFRNLWLSVCFNILRQFIEIIIRLSRVQTLQMFFIHQQSQPVSGTWSRYVNQFLITFQPLISSRIGAIRQCCWKQNHIFFISLKGMYRSAYEIIQMIFLDRLFNQHFLIDKWCNDCDGFIPI